MSCMFNCSLVWGILAFLIGLKIYLFLTTGICKSKKRMDGKTAIITGSNTGIGKETARDLAKRGAKVIMACRDLEKANEARDEIIASTGNTKVEVRHLDLGSLASVRKFAQNIIESESRLDVLVNNAGAGGLKYRITEDKLQVGMQINHFGPFLLTCLLIGLLKKSAPTRIVMVSSVLHKYAKFEVDNLNFEKWYKTQQVYNCSKLTNILVTNELARRLKGTGVTANSLHPGAVLTDIWRNFNQTFVSIMKFFLYFYFKDCYQGAQTTIYLAVSEEVEGVSGKYFQDCKEASASPDAMDEGLAKKVWERSEEFVGLKPGEYDL